MRVELARQNDLFVLLHREWRTRVSICKLYIGDRLACNWCKGLSASFVANSLPLHHPVLVKVPLVFGVAFLRHDSSGAKTQTGAARILILRDDYLVATEIESALTQGDRRCKFRR